MMHKTIRAAALPVLMLLSAAMVAHAATDMGYVDARRLINQAPQGKDEIDRLKADFAERERELRGRFDALQAEQADLEKNAVLLAEDEARTRSEDLRETERKLIRAQREYNEDYTRRRNEGLERLEKLITAAIIAVAKREKLDLVFQQVVYASKKIDMTERVLTELTRQHKKAAK